MTFCLFDDQDTVLSLRPFTHTRAVADVRCGLLTMGERWSQLLLHNKDTVLPVRTTTPLQDLYAVPWPDSIAVNAACFGTVELAAEINKLPAGARLVAADGALIAERAASSHNATTDILSTVSPVFLKNSWDIFSLNDAALRADFELITKDRCTAVIPENVFVSGAASIFVEEGATIGAGTTLNASTGPIYIGKDAEIMEGCLVRGPLALCDGAVLKMGAKVYGGTTIGPGCKVGGEVSNVVFFANSNKGHDGFLGNAVIGEWCNLGADTNCSNLKNNYDEVKIWSEHLNKSVRTGLSFCGLLMGDHSKCGINTMFNTGTVVGVSCNIFGGGFPDKFVPSFTWGGADGLVTYRLDKAMDAASRMMARRGKVLSKADLRLYRHLFDRTSEQRRLFANDPLS